MRCNQEFAASTAHLIVTVKTESRSTLRLAIELLEAQAADV
jgi:hypothetical protein